MTILNFLKKKLRPTNPFLNSFCDSTWKATLSQRTSEHFCFHTNHSSFHEHRKRRTPLYTYTVAQSIKRSQTIYTITAIAITVFHYTPSKRLRPLSDGYNHESWPAILHLCTKSESTRFRIKEFICERWC